MKIGKLAFTLFGVLLALVLAGTAGWFSLDKDVRALLATLPTNVDVLFWSQPQRDAGFRAFGRAPLLAKSRVVPAGGNPVELPRGHRCSWPWSSMPIWPASAPPGWWCCRTASCASSLTAWASTPAAAGPASPWPGRMTAILVGAAIRDGHIKSMDDKVTDQATPQAPARHRRQRQLGRWRHRPRGSPGPRGLLPGGAAGCR